MPNYPVGPYMGQPGGSLGALGTAAGLTGIVGNWIGEKMRQTLRDAVSDASQSDPIVSALDELEEDAMSKRPVFISTKAKEKKRKKIQQEANESEVLLNQAKPGGTKVVRPVSSQMLDDCTYAKSLKSYSVGCEIPVTQYIAPAVEPGNYVAGQCQNLLVNDISPGTDNNDRVGNRVMMQSLNLRFCPIDKAALIGATPVVGYESFFRLVVVYDKSDNQSNLTCPVLTDLFYVVRPTTAVGNSGTPVYSCLLPYNTDNEDRFEILYDKMVSWGAHATFLDTSGGGSVTASANFPCDQYCHDIVIDMKGRCSRYATGSGSNIPAYGAVWVYILGANATNTGISTPYYLHCCRVITHLRYSDK